MIPQLCRPAYLAVVLRNMADRVERGDSLEGNIEYHAAEGSDELYTITGMYRIGNLEGQGGVRLLGKVE